MDIRNVIEKVVYPEDGLKEIFKLQGELLQDYIKVEGLPNYPIDLNVRSSQVIIKDFIGRIVEELGEAWESHREMLLMVNNKENDLIDRDLMISHLQNFNEEISDALHFFMELLMYSGFTYDHISKWLYRGMAECGKGPDLLQDLFFRGKNSTNTLRNELLNSYSLVVLSDSELTDEFLRGGRIVSKLYHRIAPQMLWDITYNLQIARNTLKNKPWKQTEMMTDEHQYETQISKAWGLLFNFLAYSGFTPLSLYTIYYKKNMINRFRIRSKY